MIPRRNTDYQESTDEAAKIARAALPMASKLKLPVNPVSYAVFYQHISGQNPELSAAINALSDGASLPSIEDIRQLYDTYVNFSDEEALNVLRDGLRGMIESTLGSVEKANIESQSYQQTLDIGTQQLKDSNNENELIDIVAHLINHTKQMQLTSQALSERLCRTNAELTELKSEFRRVHHESLVDPLTNCTNRRGFDAAIKSLIESASAGGKTLCLLMVDIDHFKRINDEFGHLTGDTILKGVAHAIHDVIRGGDVFARFGGEEFAILLPDTPMEGAERVADNICGKVRNLHFESDRPVNRTTVSIGVALYHPSESAEQLISRADNALYRAKNSGRNRVCTHTT